MAHSVHGIVLDETVSSVNTPPDSGVSILESPHLTLPGQHGSVPGDFGDPLRRPRVSQSTVPSRVHHLMNCHEVD